MKNYAIKGIISLILLSITTSALADGHSYNSGQKRQRNRKIRSQKAKYHIETHRNYDFSACSEFNKSDDEQDDPNYFIRCEDGELVENSSVDDLLRASDAIEKKVYQDNILSDLKDFTINELQKNQDQLDYINRCVKDSSNNKCKEIRAGILKVINEELPSLRATMAMMNKPPQLRGMAPKLYNQRIKHEVPTGDIPPLNTSEVSSVREEANAIKHHFEQTWFKENAQSNHCIEQVSPTSYEFKKSNGQSGYSCASFLQKDLNREVRKRFSDYRESLKESYFQKVSQNPLLAHLNLTGQESEDEILVEVARVTSLLSNQTGQSLEEIRGLDADNISSLMGKDHIVNAYLQKQNPTRVLCDVAQ